MLGLLFWAFSFVDHRSKRLFEVVTICLQGSVAEWSIAPVLKTGDSKGSVSSNLTASAKTQRKTPLSRGVLHGADHSALAHQHRLHQLLHRQGLFGRGQFVRLALQPQIHFTQLPLQSAGARVFRGPVQDLDPWSAI